MYIVNFTYIDADLDAETDAARHKHTGTQAKIYRHSHMAISSHRDRDRDRDRYTMDWQCKLNTMQHTASHCNRCTMNWQCKWNTMDWQYTIWWIHLNWPWNWLLNWLIWLCCSIWQFKWIPSIEQHSQISQFCSQFLSQFRQFRSQILKSHSSVHSTESI